METGGVFGRRSPCFCSPSYEHQIERVHVSRQTCVHPPDRWRQHGWMHDGSHSLPRSQVDLCRVGVAISDWNSRNSQGNNIFTQPCLKQSNHQMQNNNAKSSSCTPIFAFVSKQEKLIKKMVMRMCSRPWISKSGALLYGRSTCEHIHSLCIISKKIVSDR